MRHAKKLTYDELADIYKRETFGNARSKPLDYIADWASKRKDLFETDEEGYFYETPKAGA